jgi:anaerobic selenocysteine-containing dehydrogenase
MPREVLGTCHHDCPDSCGWVVTVDDDGRATRMRGNPDHPYSRGELCPKVNRFLSRVYSPDRILHPLLRVGTKGEGRFERVTWDDAMAVVADRMNAAIERHGSTTVLPWWSAGNQSVLSNGSLAIRFFTRLGSTMPTGSLCGAVAKAGFASTVGSGRGMEPTDVRHSRLIILWATNTRLTNRHLWPFVEEARDAGAQVVVIDPVRTITADSADWFVQPMPGTDVALMLGMMHVLVRDGLIDHDYVERYAVGYEQLRVRLDEWPPERAAAICGIEVAHIERLATMYGTIRPAAIRTLIGAEHREHGAMVFRTMACLPVLVGAWRDRGGGLARSVGSWTDASVDAMAVSTLPGRQTAPVRTMSVNHLGRALTDERLDPPISVLVAWNGNPLVSVPQAELIRRGLERENLFCVVHEQFMTDTARYADVVLPATTQIEQLDAVTSWGSLHVGLNRPAIDPLGEAVSNTELFRRLSAAMGYTEPELHETDGQMLEAVLAPLGDARRADLDRDGFVRVVETDDLRPYAEGGFGTPSGKAELYSEALARLGHEPLPTYEPPIEGPGGDPSLASRFPLVLVTPKTHARFLNTSYSHLPGHGDREGGNHIELDVIDAAARRIVDGDTVRVFNDRGSLTLTARLVDRLRPGLVSVPFGWWDADAAGGTANSLANDTLTDWGGGVAFFDTLVEVELATTSH